MGESVCFCRRDPKNVETTDIRASPLTSPKYKVPRSSLKQKANMNLILKILSTWQKILFPSSHPQPVTRSTHLSNLHSQASRSCWYSDLRNFVSLHISLWDLNRNTQVQLYLQQTAQTLLSTAVRDCLRAGVTFSSLTTQTIPQKHTSSLKSLSQPCSNSTLLMEHRAATGKE